LIRALLTTVPDERDGWVGRWSPGIGDPSFMGWLTVAAYLVAAWLCWRVFRRLRAPGDRAGVELVLATVATLILALVGSARRVAAIPARDRSRTLWLVVALALLALGINKQLDLQTALTEWGRGMALSEGWYQVRRPLQVVFIAAVLVSGLIALRAASRLARGDASLRPVIGGVVFITCFVVIRASSFHHVDLLIGYDISGVRVNWLLELGGIAFVAVAAYRQDRALAAAR
jgi:tellurite resistance protein TehA-like permease